MLTLIRPQPHAFAPFRCSRGLWPTILRWAGRWSETPVVLTEQDHTWLNARLTRFVGEVSETGAHLRALRSSVNWL